MGRGEGDADNHFPGALIRGGFFANTAANAGPFAVSAISTEPSNSNGAFGFRGGR
jgi:hypothetical protein